MHFNFFNAKRVRSRSAANKFKKPRDLNSDYEFGGVLAFCRQI
jgi:hypothetical protein